MLRAIIKVGKSSKLKFHGVNAFRAITYKEVRTLLASKEDIDFVVVEDVKEEDEDILSDIKALVNQVVAYNEGEEDSSLAELEKRLEIKAVNNVMDLQLYIEATFDEDVRTFTKDGIRSDEIAEELEESVESIEENLSSDGYDEYIEDDEMTEIMSKDDMIDEEELFSVFDDENEDEDETEEDSNVASKYKEKAMALKNELEDSNEQLRIALDKVSKLSEIKKQLEDEREMYKSQLDRLELEGDVIEVKPTDSTNEQLEIQNGKLQERIVQLEIEVKKVEELNGQIEQLNAVISDCNNESEEKNEQIEQLKKKLVEERNNNVTDKYEHRIGMEAQSRINLTEIVAGLSNKLASKNEELQYKLKEIGSLMGEYQSTKAELESRDMRIEQLKHEKEGLVSSNKKFTAEKNNEIIELNKQVVELSNSNTELQQSVTILKMKSDEKDTKIRALDNELKATKDSLTSTQIALREQTEIVEKFENNNIEDMSKRIESIQTDNNAYMLQIGSYKKELQSLTSKLVSKEKELSKLRVENESLSTTAKALAQTDNSNDKGIHLKCNYTGKAKIVAVLGSGSFGVTTTAVSLTRRLTGRVLIMDCDTVNPKIDSWFQASPLIRNLPDINSEMKKTALGALIDKGADYIIAHEAEVIQNITRGRSNDKIIDYFGGSYSKLSEYKLVAVDFTKIMNFLGSKYDYIVVDLGRIGGGVVSEAFIEMFSGIATKNILVALHDKSDIRSLALKVRNAKVSAKSLIWVLNMAKSGALTDIMKKSIGDSQYVIMPMKMDIYAEMKSFEKIPLLKDKLTELSEIIINA